MMESRLARSARATMTTAILSALLVSCSGSNNRPTLGADPLQTAITAMKAAGSGRISGSITGAGGAAAGSLVGSWQGDLTGKFTARAVFLDSRRQKLAVEARLVNRTFYYSRAVGSGSNTSDPYSIFVRTGSDKPWRTAGLGGITDGVTSLFSPLATLQWLKRLGVSFYARPGERVGSAKTTRLTTKTRLLIGPFLNSTVSLWVDGQGRVLRVSTHSAIGGAQYDVTDFGAALTVAPPPASEIATKSELPVIEPAGGFTTVKAGTTTGVTWALQRARGTQGTVCWRWRATPALPQTQQKTPATPRCLVPPPARSSDPSDTVQFVVIGNGQASYDALVVLLPPGVKHLTFGFVGGKLESLPVASPMVWVGKPEPTKAYLGVTLADGILLACGAGAVSVPSDLTDPSLTAAVATAAWGCLPPG